MMPVISRDEIKDGYVTTYGLNHDQLPRETNRLVTDLFFEVVNRYLEGEVSVIIEAAFQHKVWESRMPNILELASVRIVLCSTNDEVVAKRHLARGRPFRESYEAPRLDVPTIHVSTDEGYNPSIDEIVNQFHAGCP